MTTTYRINDLAHPRLPVPIQVLNRVLAPFTRLVRLDEKDLLKTPRRIMLERGVHSNWAKKVGVIAEVDRVLIHRLYCYQQTEKKRSL